MIKPTKIRPRFTDVITTAHKWTKEDFPDGSIMTKGIGSIKETQTVIAVGPSVRDVNVGDLVLLDFTKFATRKFAENSIKNDIQGMNPVTGYSIPVYTLGDEETLYLDDRNIVHVIEEWEEIEPEVVAPTSAIIQDTPSIVSPSSGIII